ncbi:MAG: membrane protein insertion efficiency factor YidD [Armatimonadota bacterium]|jgi:putative membrane protein insertion efficiency factor|nr:membrane protein insertion efficiency factor YidD [Armatimonadota bacterium]
MRRVLIYAIRIYQKLSRYRPRVCRYEPTCSEYAVQAIEKYGPVKGVGMAAWRILRCNPWSAGGFDPVK